MVRLGDVGHQRRRTGGLMGVGRWWCVGDGWLCVVGGFG